MQRVLFTLLLFLGSGLAGCNHRGADSTGSGGPIETKVIEERAAPPEARLAYAHIAELVAPEVEREPLLRAGQQTCQSIAQSQQCVLLEMSVATGKEATASLKIRATAQGVQTVLERFKSQGKLTSFSTHAEDLAAPLSDGARKLAMLKDYRAKLEALSNRAAGNVDALIKVSHELAQVQSELDDAATAQARLQQRVDTQTLQVYIRDPELRRATSPLQRAFSDFGEDLSRGLAGFVTALAYLLPWLLVLAGLVWAVLRWRRRKQ
ncbi:DUF4349 domain-containing protein [Paucibacter sp. KBW04]|uniref:DUF4349 domain-containing protein n=1 Tax=Paucibacter sp. KBW04 TaxID=2153361 RepID=UPI000F55F2AF|nr:DUF4349 domain-containing protein [Paucibacter sp. KBW04]RQO53463.1 DUF4349 domain-containing protein [Paucibacter sp. KBW04]